jgi:EamA domain-containing membrane protein RarD
MKELIFDGILLILIMLCFSYAVYTRHRLEMNIMAVQGLQHQIDELKTRLDN